eukprot:TRINITY_DN45392_c0_g1_i1.p1 TRINITY_DN45392_c0_g1~~TRINITY_DN45392_c0_g1_i1.p1  ORF type:complete len:299 (+),score=38.35 TRINITY_DN45392_c0_g1_i1:60-899(+)
MPFGLHKHFFLFVLPLVVFESWLFNWAFSADLRTCQVILGLLGLWWCFAALWVEVRIARVYPGMDMEHPWETYPFAYKPFCDFAPWANCSQVLMSPPGRFLLYFGISKRPDPADGLVGTLRSLIEVPNPTLGVIFFACHLFYPALLLLPFVNTILPWLFFAACCFVGGMTVWLAYNLAFVLRDFCVVCVSMYVANFALIPMMFGLCREQLTTLGDFDSFFGQVPASLLYPFLLVDAIMGVAVLLLFLERYSAWARDLELLPSHGDYREGKDVHGAYQHL